MYDCLEALVVFHPTLDVLRSHLPDGFEPIPAVRQWQQMASMPFVVNEALTGRGWFAVDVHGCAHEDGGLVASDVSFGIPVVPSALDAGMEDPGASVIELGRAGNGESHTMMLLLEQGFEPFADRVEARHAADSVRSMSVDVFDGEEQVLTMTVPPTPSPMGFQGQGAVPTPIARFWTPANDGWLRTQWTGVTHGEPENIGHFGGQPTCTFAESTIAAAVLGGTTCDAIRQAGTPIQPLLLEAHDMDMVWSWHSR